VRGWASVVLQGLLPSLVWGCGPSQPAASPSSDPSPSSADTGQVVDDTGSAWLDTGDTSTAAPTADSADSGVEPREEVAPGIYPLDGLAIDTPPTDLAPLDPLLDRAEVVAFGESVHYSGGFHELRHRAMQYAVEAHGVRAVGIEGHWWTAEAYARPYVEHCEGTVADGLRGLTFDVWASQSSGEFLEFLCTWNTDHPDDPVTFFGVDVQAPWLDSAWLIELFASEAPEPSVVDDLERCLAWGVPEDELLADPEVAAVLYGTGSVDPADTDACLAGVAAAEAWAATAEPELLAVDAEAPTLARVALRSLAAGHQTYAQRVDWDPRDEAMAGNFLDLHALRAPDAKALYWAHNAHIVANGEDLTDSVYPDGWKDAGSHLRDALGPGYVPVALMATEVTWTWAGQPEASSSAVAATVERRLNGLGEELLFVDVAAALADGTVLPDDRALTFGHPGTATGWLGDHYDGVLFLQASDGMEYWTP